MVLGHIVHFHTCDDGVNLKNIFILNGCMLNIWNEVFTTFKNVFKRAQRNKANSKILMSSDRGYRNSLNHSFNFSIPFDIFKIKPLGGNHQGSLQMSAL
jgi:hypothetical protein